MTRIVCQFSCGAASAVATKLALASYGATHEVIIVNAFIAREDDDNRRFAADCERWFGREIIILRDEKYGADPIRVFRRKQYIKGFAGAACSHELKRKLLSKIRRDDDTLVFGFTAEEADRFDDFVERNSEMRVIAPLIEQGLSKDDCKAMILRAGIRLPRMYELGYDNANCKCCVKGGMAYFRACREDFPEDFRELAEVEKEIGPDAYLFRDRKSGNRFPLSELGSGPVHRNEALPSCSFFCELAESEYAA
ncbi:MAG: hypothetical protein LBD67_01050 [Candidatus Accumulibacter sp.]|jgi:3'-phosphoadenosine 5'-phosphosulfate sulfotransferase (PAPS reductase)/FAD synthetase|nr:hypothetical protein [Accumulibacter sp.]